MRMPHISLAFTGITATLIALFAPTAQATSNHPHRHTGDCTRVAPADRPLCRNVQRQHAYGYVYQGAEVTVPTGRAIVHDITHSRTTKTTMRRALTAAAHDYNTWVTGVSVNMNTLAEACGTDCVYVVKFRDADGKPGGIKLTEIITQRP